MAGTSVEKPLVAELVIFSGETQRRYPLSKPVVTLGRRPDRDVVLSQPHVSREHALIEQRGSEYFIVDSGSSHGTFVNGQPARESALQSGDRIELGAMGGSSYLVFYGPNASKTASQAGSSDSHELLSKIRARQTSGDMPG